MSIGRKKMRQRREKHQPRGSQFRETRHEHFGKDSFHPQVRDLQQVEMGFPDNNFSTFVTCS